MSIEKLKRNHVFIAFEVYFTRPYQDTPEVAPFELGAVRVQGGVVVADFHAFLRPRQFIKRSVDKPLPNDKHFLQK